MKTRVIALALTLATLSVGVGVVVWAQRSPSTVRVAPAVLNERIVARAVVEPIDGIAQVRARAEGRVSAVHVNVGASVREGTLLAEIDSDVSAIDLRRLEAEAQAQNANARSVREGARPEERRAIAAERDAAQSEVRLARDRADRLERLHATGSAPQAQAEEARFALRAAESRLATAEARLRLAGVGGRPSDVRAATEHAAAARSAVQMAQTVYARARITAPIDGVILSRNVDVGDTVTLGVTGASDTLFELANTARVELRAEIEETDALRVTVDSPVEITSLGATRSLGTGRVVRIGPRIERRDVSADNVRVRADGAVRPIWVRVDPQPTESPWPVGFRVEVAVILSPRRVPVAVPRGAVAVEEGHAVVRRRRSTLWPWADTVAVELRGVDQNTVEISGISPGSLVELRDTLPARQGSR